MIVSTRFESFDSIILEAGITQIMFPRNRKTAGELDISEEFNNVSALDLLYGNGNGNAK